MSSPSSSSVPAAPPEDDAYERAKADPVASLLVGALQEQDARTYNGSSGDTGRVALDLAQAVLAVVDEPGIRADERRKVAVLLEEHGEVLASWPRDTAAAIAMVAFLLRLPGGGP